MYYLKLPTRPPGPLGLFSRGPDGREAMNAFEAAASLCSSDHERWMLPKADQEFQYETGDGQTLRSRKIVVVHQCLRKRWGRWGRLAWKNDGLKIKSRYHIRLTSNYTEIELDLEWWWKKINDLRDPRAAIAAPYLTALFDAVTQEIVMTMTGVQRIAR